jgi:hypothetical protein
MLPGLRVDPGVGFIDVIELFWIDVYAFTLDFYRSLILSDKGV